MLNIWKSAAGMLELEVVSADLEQTFREAAAHRIPLYHVTPAGPLTARLRIRRSDCRAFEKICSKRGDKLKICRRLGLFWTGKQLLRRPVLVLGSMAVLGLFLFLPTRVLFIRVTGNETVPTNYILEAAEDCGIRFGVSRRQVRSEKMKNALLQRAPKLGWAGINTKGCTAEISVRRRHEKKPEQELPAVSSVVAARDGIIDSCTALKGTLLCAPGQAVSEGQVLISGYMDCGSVIQAVRADGEIYGRTLRSFTAVTPETLAFRGRCQETSRVYTLCVGKKRIKLAGNSGNWDPTCGRMYTEYYITLPGGYVLPLALGVDVYRRYEMTAGEQNPEQVQKELQAFAERCLKEQMAAGSLIQKSEQMSRSGGLYRLQGQYLCHEMIGRVRQEKIGE